MRRKKESDSQMKGMQSKSEERTEAEAVRVVTHYKHTQAFVIFVTITAISSSPIYRVLTSETDKCYLLQNHGLKDF